MAGRGLSGWWLGILVWGFGVLVVEGRALAEPWLSTRFAQNCAGCHAPGRVNLKAPERRCTLSCQGCHINPNGGGLRSAYGKWNEDRWLASFRADILGNKKLFAPTDKQTYGNGHKVFKDGKLSKEQAAKNAKEPKKRRPVSYQEEGFQLVEVTGQEVPEKPYLRDGREFQISQSAEEFYYQIPEDDPIRQLKQQKTSAGADIRWQTMSYKYDFGDETREDTERWNSFLMTADFALEARPLYKYLHLVYEARMLGNPAPETQYEQQLGTASTRSLYAMVSDLPFNTFVMGGYYRPLFGNYIPDHYAIQQQITSYAMTGQPVNYGIVWNAMSIGTAPNVPYLNVHVIGKKFGDPDDKTAGFAANAGMRFVTLGASLNYSYWRTTDEREDQTTGVEMHSIGAAARVWRTVMSFDAVAAKRDVDTTDYREGGVYSFDTYTQVWRENYFTLMLAKANVTKDMLPGDVSQVKTGIRSFLFPGVDVLFAIEQREDTTKDPKTDEEVTDKVSGFQSQLHLYF